MHFKLLSLKLALLPKPGTLPVTLSLMQNFEEKEIKITQHDCVQSRDEPSTFSTNGTQMLNLTSECLTTTPPGLPVRGSELMRQSAVFTGKLN